MVTAAPGTQLLIGLLPRLFPQTEVAVLGPTYAEHAACWQASGASVREAAAFEQLRHHQAAVLCNPNNPDGRRIRPTDLLALAERLRLLVVDEAFADFEGADISLAPHIANPGVVVLRSFGKAFGLAGVRLGFALALPRTASVIRDALGPWAVSGPAISIGCQALADTAWLARSAARLNADAARLDALLMRAGCRIAGGTRLFRLIESARAPALFERLGQAGIVARAFEDRPDRLRFGLPGPDDWDRVEAALAG